MEREEIDSPSPPGREDGLHLCRRDRIAAWSTVVSAFLIQFCGFGYASAFGVFQDFYVREFLTKSTSSQISWIGSTQAFLLLTMGLFSGQLFDKGYCYHLVIVGAIIHTVSLFMISLAKPGHFYEILLAQGFGVGIGAGLSYAPSLAVLAQHFTSTHSRAQAMGIAIAGCSFGGVVHPILINQLLHKGDSGGLDDSQRRFKRATLASAGLITGLMLISLVLLRPKYPKTTGPEIEKDTEKHSQKVKPANIRAIITKFASDWPYVFYVFGMTLFEMTFFFPSFFLQLFSIEHGLDSSFAFYTLSILNGLSFLGRITPAFLACSLGVANMLVMSTAACSIVQFCLFVVRNAASVATFAALYGFFSGVFATVMGPMLVLLADNPAEVGARMGMCFAIMGFGCLTGTPIAGALLTSDFIWWRPITFSGTVSLVGCMLFTGCRIILGKRRGSFWII